MALTYSVIGSGAVGGYYGGRLAKAGRTVRFLLRSDYEYVREHGLQVDSVDGSFHLQPLEAYNDTRAMPKSDVVLVALKTTTNHRLPQLLAPIVDEKTLVVLIQNGIGVEADVQQMFPNLQLVAGLAFICSAKTSPGRVNHQCYGSINFGNYSASPEAVALLLDDFLQAGVKAAEVPYLEARWRKAVWNMPFNGMTVALNTSTDQLLRCPATRLLIRRQMLEVVGAARAQGVEALTDDFADEMLRMTDAMVPYSPSMKLDYDFHRAMEIHYLYTRPIEEARRAGFAMPRLAMLEAELMFLSVHSS